jgi:myo-inositol 2-dehydrogenase / D-chiro-inositol 1-dehydrogenase
MKLILSLVALSALSYDVAVLGFHVHQPLQLGSRVSISSRSTLLSMNIESKETKEIKVGVIGCGRIGVVHLEAITKAPGVRAVIVSNPTVSKAEKAAKQFNVARWTDDAMEVITDPEVDAVWICSPSSVHAEQIKAAAANGKHVFCEKPIATDLPETVEAINACNEAGVKLMIGLQRRFDQNFKRVQTAVKNKEVGEPIMVRACVVACVRASFR